ncbi:uncharacterized protein [Eucyclogobius newberryi]|uniref:uncharacterized protein isoform X3 n=1 Tax=Eucyclogobius newberryi TaxID=166745 RepID=UPI003B5B5AF3
MDRYRYLMLPQGRVLVLGVLQIASAGLCVICGVMDMVFRKDTLLSTTRTPVWGGLIMAIPGVLSLFASQRKNHILTFVLHRMVKGANATIFLCCVLGLLLSSAIIFVSCRSLPFCGCYDATTGLESLVPQCDPGNTELVWTWRAADDDRLFNSPAQSSEPNRVKEERSQAPPTLASYRRLT